MCEQFLPRNLSPKPCPFSGPIQASVDSSFYLFSWLFSFLQVTFLYKNTETSPQSLQKGAGA